MVKHSEAINRWKELMLHFPYTEAFEISKTTGTGILPLLGRLQIYFKTLEDTRDPSSFTEARKFYFALWPNLPKSKIQECHQDLYRYFSQGLVFTPIDITTGRSILDPRPADAMI